MNLSRQIRIVNCHGEQRDANLAGDLRQWTENGIACRECSLRLWGEGFDIRGIGDDFFEAFCHIREQLAREGLFPLCYGASRNVYPSGMQRDMSAGLRAYRIRMGQAARADDVVEIFQCGADIEVSTVEEQKNFWSEWLRRVSP